MRDQSARDLSERTAAGLERFAARDYEGAAREFRASLALAPRSADARLNLASALCGLGRLQEAAPLAREAYLQDPGNPNYRECLRFIALNLGTGAGGTFGHAQDVMALIGLGNNRRQRGDYEAAEHAYRRAERLAPDDPFVANRLGALLCCKERYAESAPYFRRSAGAGLRPDGIIDFSPGFMESLAARGDAWRSTLQPARPEAGPPPRDIAFLLSCDSGYFNRFAFALVHSLERNAGVDYALHFHVVNADAGVDRTLARIAQRFPAVALGVTRETRATGDPYSAKTYYACARFLLLPAILEARACPVAVLDLDVLAQRALGPLLERLRGHDLALPLIGEGRREPAEMLSASFVYFAATPAARRAAAFAGAYIAHFLAQGRQDWFLEQIALLACRAQASRLGVRLALLPEAVLESSDAPGLQAGGEDAAFFWTNAHSVPEHAARLDSPRFLEYAADPPSGAR